MQRIPHPRASDSNGSRDGAASKIGRFPVFRSCLVYVASFSAAGLNQPYLPVWLTSRGLSESEIALVISTPMVLRLIVTPLFGTLADRAGSHRTVICIMAATAFLLAFALSLAHGFWPILVVATAMLLVWQSIGPIVDASVLQLIRRGIANDFGRIRLWGSASFAAASVLGGFALGWGALTQSSRRSRQRWVFLLSRPFSCRSPRPHPL
jgi:MFS transporter, PPP family, 3-phenylpropionic acid transporter